MAQVTWVLESEIFPESHPPLRKAVCDAGHRLVSTVASAPPIGTVRSPLYVRHASLLL